MTELVQYVRSRLGPNNQRWPSIVRFNVTLNRRTLTCGRTGLPASQLTALYIQHTVHAIQGSIVIPTTQIFLDLAARRNLSWQSRRLAAGAEDVNHPIHYRPHIHCPLVAALLGRWDQRPNQTPFLVRHLAPVAQPATVTPTPVLHRPHAFSPADCCNPSEPRVTQTIQNVLVRTLSWSGRNVRKAGRRAVPALLMDYRLSVASRSKSKGSGHGGGAS
jgi:hypothetical protein